MDEDGDVIASGNGKGFIFGELGKVESARPPLTGEEPWVREVSKEEAFRLVNIRRS